MTSPGFAHASTEPIAGPVSQSTFVVAARGCGIAATERLRRRLDAAIRICPDGLRFLCAPSRPQEAQCRSDARPSPKSHRLQDESVAEIVPNTQPVSLNSRFANTGRSGAMTPVNFTDRRIAAALLLAAFRSSAYVAAIGLASHAAPAARRPRGGRA